MSMYYVFKKSNVHIRFFLIIIFYCCCSTTMKFTIPFAWLNYSGLAHVYLTEAIFTRQASTRYFFWQPHNSFWHKIIVCEVNQYLIIKRAAEDLLYRNGIFHLKKLIKHIIRNLVLCNLFFTDLFVTWEEFL